MLLSKAHHAIDQAVDLTDAVTASVASHLPRPLAGPVQLAVSTLTWLPRRVAGTAEHVAEEAREAARTADEAGASNPIVDDAEEPREPEVVLTLDRPADELEPPIDVVGEALRAEAEQPAPTTPVLEDEGHVEVEEEVVYSTSSEGS